MIHAYHSILFLLLSCSTFIEPNINHDHQRQIVNMINHQKVGYLIRRQIQHDMPYFQVGHVPTSILQGILTESAEPEVGVVLV